MGDYAAIVFSVIYIGIITAVVMKLDKNKKARQAAAKRQPAAVEPEASAEPPSGSLNARTTEGLGLRDEAGCVGGSIVHTHLEEHGQRDDEGCVGGSIAHARHEGESRAEHRRHMAAASRREQQESAARETAEAVGDMNLKRLRQAVIMAEILDKPRALRRGRL